MEFLKDIFTNIDSTESMYFLGMMVIAFLLGFIIAWIAWGSQAARRRTELNKLKAEQEALQVEYTGFKEQYDLKEADLQKAILEVEEARKKMRDVQAEKGKLLAENQRANDKIAQLEASEASYKSTVEDLNDQILGLKAKYREVTSEHDYTGPTLEKMAEMEVSYKQTVSRLTAIEEKLNNLEGENDELKKELETIKEHEAALASQIETAGSDGTQHKQEVEQARREIMAAIGTQIPAATPDEKDNLQLINGLGPFIEGKLNELGLFTFEQIHQLDDALVERLTLAIEFFPGRIQRDDWVGQAGKLASVKAEDPQSLESQTEVPTNQEDLKIIEGIDEKVEEVLKGAGVQNWKELSETDADRIRILLDQAGEQFRNHDPSSWPQQAQLALNGEWDMLKEYQEFLVGGKKEVE